MKLAGFLVHIQLNFDKTMLKRLLHFIALPQKLSDVPLPHGHALHMGFFRTHCCNAKSTIRISYQFVSKWNSLLNLYASSVVLGHGRSLALGNENIGDLRIWRTRHRDNFSAHDFALVELIRPSLSKDCSISRLRNGLEFRTRRMHSRGPHIPENGSWQSRYAHSVGAKAR